jgi:DNA-binding NarL/FixJ family response regulator
MCPPKWARLWLPKPREIAAELVLSVRTVEKHVAAIYGKTGTRGRVTAATYALRRAELAPAVAG